MQHHRTRIKYCGLTREQDVLTAVALGVDAIGLVFYPPSARHIEPVDAACLARLVPPFVSVTGLFCDPEPAWVRQVLTEVPLDLLQFHGAESDAFCRLFGRPYIKGIRVRSDTDLAAMPAQWPGSRGLLLDAWHPELAGGTGTRFDWERIPDAWRSRIILAGGLTPESVGDAIARIHPFGVDVSGGIEQARGRKDAGRMRAFMQAVRQEDSRYDKN